MKQQRVLTVQYQVPVYVDVNLDTGEVERVVQVDEAIVLAEKPVGFSFLPEFAGAWEYRNAALNPANSKRAIEIAETVEWPMWETP